MTNDKSFGEASYEQFAERYAQGVRNAPYNAHYDRPAVISLLPPVAGLRVLDAGCGPGEYTAWLLDQGAEVVGCDVTPDFVRIARERFGERATIHHADLSKPLTFAADAEFDLIVSSLVLDYIADWGGVFREFARVLKAGGTVVFSCEHPTSKFHLGKMTDYFEREAIESVWGGWGEPKPTVTAYRRPLQLMLNPLLENGFALERILEPQPVPSFQQVHPDPQRYHELMTYPAFIAFRARRP